MFRAVFCLWFAITSLIGPAICCCAAKRVEATPVVPSEPAAKAVAESTCPFCAADKRKAAPAPKPIPAGEPKQCPCQAALGPLDIAPAPPNGVSRLADELHAIHHLAVAVLGTVDSTAPEKVLGLIEPLWPPGRPFNRSLLSSYQILRC